MAIINTSVQGGTTQYPLNAQANKQPTANPQPIVRDSKQQMSAYISDYNKPTSFSSSNGFIAGIKSQPSTSSMLPGSVSKPTASQMQSYGSGPAISSGNRVSSQYTSASVYDEISALENSYEQRRTRAAEDIWGKPTIVKNPDGTSNTQWGTNGVNWLGMEPGDIYTPTFNRPMEDAPYKDWVQYRDQLKGQVRVPLYSETSLNDVFDNLGIDGIAQVQTAFAKAGFYSGNHRFAPGVLSREDYQVMSALMGQANMNGMKWEDVLSMYLSNPQGSRGSGGGGGGGGGVSTAIQYTQTSIEQGRKLLNSVLTDALGRIPTDTELAQFMRQLNRAESRSPVIQTVRRAGNTTVSKVTPSTVDSAEMAQQFAQSVEGGDPYRERTASGYLDMLAQRLTGRL